MSQGVQLTLSEAGYDEWAPAPVADGYVKTRVDGDVKLVSGQGLDGVGLGCENADGSLQFLFLLRPGQQWSLETTLPAAGVGIQVLASGTNASILPPLHGNLVSAVCATQAGSTDLMLAVNGTPVANFSVDDVQPGVGWVPLIIQCSCGGVDTGQFTYGEQSAC